MNYAMVRNAMLKCAALASTEEIPLPDLVALRDIWGRMPVNANQQEWLDREVAAAYGVFA